MLKKREVTPEWEGVQLPVLSYDSARSPEVRSNVHIKAHCIGGRDWSMRNLYAQADMDEQRELADAISWELASLEIEQAYAPSVSHMSGVIVHDRDLSDHITLSFNDLWRNKQLPSDGVRLRVNDAFIASMGGCGAIACFGQDFCIAAHAGRDSALDRAVISGKYHERRRHFSVVNAMAEFARQHGRDPESLTFVSLFTLPQSRFGHPLSGPDGAYHASMARYVTRQYDGDKQGIGSIAFIEDDYVYLDLHRLLVRQAIAAGFQVDLSAHHSLPGNEGFGDTRHPDPNMRQTFNLVIVQRVR